MTSLATSFREQVGALHGTSLFRKSVLNLSGGADVLERLLASGHYRHVLEIGTYRGVTAAYMAQFCERVTTIDLVRGKLERAGETFDRRGFWRGLGADNIDLRLVQSDAEKAELIHGIDFDLALIDGDHAAPAPARDFALVRHCGAVLFHDYGGDNGVTEVVNGLPSEQVEIMGIFALWRSPAVNMDRIIANYSAIEDEDLMLCRDHGVAYQRDMSTPVAYDDAYFDKYVSYEGQEIAQQINHGRVRMVNAYVGPLCKVLDVGIGSGEFIKHRPKTFGHDVNPKAKAWLIDRCLWAADLRGYPAYTFWDVLEHVPVPQDYFRQMSIGSYLFTSLPIFDDLDAIRKSKHYRPNEHYYYFTEEGFVGWMALHGFRLLEQSDFETKAGRDSIGSFAFRREIVRDTVRR